MHVFENGCVMLLENMQHKGLLYKLNFDETKDLKNKGMKQIIENANDTLRIQYIHKGNKISRILFLSLMLYG